MKKLLIFSSFLIILNVINAQQMPFFSQYMHNPYAINPAATGINDELPLAACYRKQWASFPQSPSIQYISGHMKVYKSMGAGAKITNYTAGPLRKTGGELTYSYHFKLKEGVNLSFGLSGLFYQFHLDKSGMSVEDEDDVVFADGSDKMFVIDAIFGTYLYGEKYYAGLSIPQLLNRNVDLKTDNIIQEKQVRHYYLHGGYLFDLNSDFTLEPSLLFKFMESGLFQVDINAIAEYKKMFLLGLSLRTSDAVVLQLGYRYKEFRIGYSYDITISGLRGSAFGSHEILLIYSLKNFLQ
jgi:type IX secretion system PorP/SprF family membrane protein